jgi:hypothetical protein
MRTFSIQTTARWESRAWEIDVEDELRDVSCGTKCGDVPAVRVDTDEFLGRGREEFVEGAFADGGGQSGALRRRCVVSNA